MAMIDYGAVVFKNGVQINSDQFFMDMESSVGWTDAKKIRYDDCDCISDDGYSMCQTCPRHIQVKEPDGDGFYEVETRDCHGAGVNFIDELDGNKFAYIGDEHVTCCFYKDWLTIVTEKSNRLDFWGTVPSGTCGNRKSLRLAFFDAMIHVKEVAPRVFHLQMDYGSDHYHVIYGYGVDANMDAWNRIKVTYLGKTSAKRIDKLYQKITSNRRCTA